MSKAATMVLLVGSAYAGLQFVASLTWAESHYDVKPPKGLFGPGGAIGACLPPDATDILSATNMDSMEFYAAFRFASGSARAWLEETVPVDPGQVKYRSPRNYPWWGGDLVARALRGEGLDVRLCSETGRSFVVVDETTSRGYVWWVPRSRPRSTDQMLQ